LPELQLYIFSINLSLSHKFHHQKSLKKHSLNSLTFLER